MNKVCVVYWSGTGNTEEMAEMVCDGVCESGGECSIVQVQDFFEELISEYDAFAFGCPSMGDECLEETEFEPVFSQIEEKLCGKRIALFGSYGWGMGEWMKKWEKRCLAAGAVLACESVICENEPDEQTSKELKCMATALLEK